MYQKQDLICFSVSLFVRFFLRIFMVFSAAATAGEVMNALRAEHAVDLYRYKAEHVEGVVVTLCQ